MINQSRKLRLKLKLTKNLEGQKNKGYIMPEENHWYKIKLRSFIT